MFKLLSNFATYLLNLFSGQKSDAPIYEKIVDFAFERLYEMINVIAYGFSGIILVISGFLATYFNLLNQFDRMGYIYLNAVSTGGIVLIFIGFGILYNASKQEVTTSTSRKDMAPPSPSPVEIAVAALIQDFVKERERERELKSSFNNQETLNKDEILSKKIHIQ